MQASAFEAALEEGGPILIDGGLATYCESVGLNISGKLWSAALLESDPGALVAAHRAFLEAGARIIATASYQASRKAFAAAGMTERQADKLMSDSVTLARAARDDFLAEHAGLRTPLIAASVGPYGAALADGSEYRGDYRVEARELADFHRERLTLFDNSAADVLACETIPSYLEAQVLGELLQHVTTPAWVSFSCRDGTRISDGTPLADAVDLFSEHPRVLAVGVNCTPPQFMLGLIREIRSALPGKAIIVYPNSGERYDASTRTWSGTATPTDWSIAVREWVDAGATLVGGCCRTGPEHIRAMAKHL